MVILYSHYFKIWKTRGPHTKDAIIIMYCYNIIEVVIGFLSKSYSVVESDGTVSIRFGVITRSLRTTISVQLSFSAGSALCKL